MIRILIVTLICTHAFTIPGDDANKLNCYYLPYMYVRKNIFVFEIADKKAKITRMKIAKNIF